jgi:hypothetical protein
LGERLGDYHKRDVPYFQLFPYKCMEKQPIFKNIFLATKQKGAGIPLFSRFFDESVYGASRQIEMTSLS